MNFARKLFFAATLAALVTGRPAHADDLQRVLHDLDVAAANFRTTSADVQFDTIQTVPFPDKDTQRGMVYYERKGASFSMAAHIEQENGKPAQKIYTFTDGQFKLDNVGANQVITYKRASKFESYVMLGFGASGKDLAEKWEIKDDGPETVNGSKVEKLELVAKDPTVRSNLPKVTVWIDTARAISVKVVFDEGQGVTREGAYSNIKVNSTLPADAFRLKIDSQTQYSSQ